MYLDFFGLEKEPFHITPDPDFLFPSPSHKEAFATVMYGVQQQKGFVVVTGEVGTGKTTILRAYLQKLKGSDIQPIYLFDPHLDFDELLEAILAELGAPHDAGHTQFSRLQWLRHYLIDAYSTGRSVVLIVDEAQNMPVETLEKLRVLTNLETTKDKLLQVLLVGQPELEEKLSLHQLRQLTQRIAVRAHLRALSVEEATDYVKHRIRQAGGTPETVFAPGALKAIIAHAKGNPRVLNITCDNVLINAYGAGQSPVTAGLVRTVIKELNPAKARKAIPWQRYAQMAAAAGVIALVGASAVVLLRGNPGAEAAAPAPMVASNGETAQPGAAEPQVQTEAPAPQLDGAATPDVAQPPTAVQESPTTPEPSLDASASIEQDLSAVAAEAAEPETAAPQTEAVTAETTEPVSAEPVATAEAASPTPAAEIVTAEAPAVEEPAAPAEPATEAPTLDAAAAPEQEAAPAEAEKPAIEFTTPMREPSRVAAAPSEDAKVVHVVTGDNLSELLVQQYGSANQSLIEKVQAHNPKVVDPNLILAGEDLVFPDVTKNAENAVAGTDSPAPAN